MSGIHNLNDLMFSKSDIKDKSKEEKIKKIKDLKRNLREKLAKKFAEDEDMCNYKRFADDEEDGKEFSDEELSKIEAFTKKFTQSIPVDTIKLEAIQGKLEEIEKQVQSNWAFSSDTNVIAKKLNDIVTEYNKITEGK